MLRRGVRGVIAARDNDAMPRTLSQALQRTSKARKTQVLPLAAPTSDADGVVPVQPPRAARVRKEAAICAEAERQFAQFGFEGASLEQIASAFALSRHNLLY